MKIGKIFLKDPLSKDNYFFDHLFFDLPFKLEFESIIPPPRTLRFIVIMNILPFGLLNYFLGGGKFQFEIKAASK